MTGILNDDDIMNLPAQTTVDLDAVPDQLITEKQAKSLPVEVYTALLERHARLDSSCKRCYVRPRKCPWKDGLLHTQAVGIDPDTKDRHFAVRCDNPGCPSRQIAPPQTRAEKQQLQDAKKGLVHETDAKRVGR